MSYIEKVHQRHEEWIQSLKDVPVLTIDTGIYDIYNEQSQAEVVGLIQKFITDLKEGQPRHKTSPMSESPTKILKTKA